MQVKQVKSSGASRLISSRLHWLAGRAVGCPGRTRQASGPTAAQAPVFLDDAIIGWSAIPELPSGYRPNPV